jgi:hypothetical protein
MTRFSSASFSDFASKSKIPPELIAATFEIGDVVGDGIDAFCVHDGSAREICKRPIIRARQGDSAGSPRRDRHGDDAQGPDERQRSSQVAAGSGLP